MIYKCTELLKENNMASPRFIEYRLQNHQVFTIYNPYVNIHFME